jgi:site-specific recombinase XerD
VPTALTEGESNRILVEAGLRAGLREEQVPDWSALRHFYRSYALEAGLPFEAINALIGHQALGCDLYNRALDQQVDAVLAHGQRLAHRIAQEVGWNDEAN